MSAQKDNDEDVLPLDEVLEEEIILDADVLSPEDENFLETELVVDESTPTTEDALLDDLL